AKRNLGVVFGGLVSGVASCVLALVALVGSWWQGAFQPNALAISGRGDMSLWSVRATSDFFGLSLPALDLTSAAVCGRSVHLEICDKIYKLRALVGCSLGCACIATLCAAAALFSLSGCGEPRHSGLISQVSASFFAAASCGCMIAALCLGASSDTQQWLMEVGTLGTAAYCAIVQVVVSFAVVVIFGVSACTLRQEQKEVLLSEFGERAMRDGTAETEVCDFLIRPGSELLLCKAGLERLLGPIAHAVLGHRRAFDAQISQEFSGELLREAAQRRAELNRARWSQDKSRLACRQPLPTASEKQLVFNFEALRRILDHIYDHTTQMQRLTSEINSDSEDNSVLGSFVSSLPPIKPGSRGSARDDDDDDSKSSKSSKSEGASSTSSLTASSQMAPSLNPSLMRARDNSISDEEELHLAENPPARRRASLHWVELRQSAKLLPEPPE
ncbi:unnamed protein product, partial [Effrenium voratum]